MGSRRTSILVLAIVLVVCLIVLVGRIRDFYDQPDVFVVGGIYSIPGAQGGEAHMKILEADEDNVHLRLYTGPAPDDDAADVPADPVEAEASAFARALGGGGPNAAQQALAAALAQGRAYVDVSRRRFARLGAQLRSMEEVEPGELREYNEWRRSRGLRPVRAPEPEGFSP